MRRFLLPPGPKPPAQVASVCNASSSRPVALMHSTVCDRINRAAALDSTLFDIGRIEMAMISYANDTRARRRGSC
jgi:hypothetical protein